VPYKSGGEILIEDIEAVKAYWATMVNIVLARLIRCKVLGEGGSAVVIYHLLAVSAVVV